MQLRLLLKSSRFDIQVRNSIIVSFITFYDASGIGIAIRIYNSTLPAQVESYIDMVALKVFMSNNDSIARAKITGTAGHRSN